MKYSISILAHNNIAITRNCLTSVFHAGTALGEAELLLTDNGSTDSTGVYFETIAANRAHISVTHNPHNLGFIEPNLRALEIAKGEFFVLLNNDCLVPMGWLDKLAAPFADPTVALTGPAGYCCSLAADFRGYHGDRFEYLQGSCLMGRTAFLRDIGLFDPMLVGAYGEDADLCLRARKAGYQIVGVDLNVRHLGGMTSALVPESNEWLKKNLSYLTTKWKDYLAIRAFDHAQT